MKGLLFLGLGLLLTGCSTCLRDRVEYRQVVVMPPVVSANHFKCAASPNMTENIVDLY